MTINYQNGIIQRGDCLELIKDIPDESIDMIFSDVPYKLIEGGCTGKISDLVRGTTFNSEFKSLGTGGFKHNSITFKEWMPDFYRVLKNKSHCYLMVNDRNLFELIGESQKNKFKLLNILVWKKNNAMPNHWYMKNAEFIVMLRKGGAKYINNQGSKQILEFDNIKKKNHPTEKPVGLIKQLIENSTNIGDIVLDPFSGSFSTSEACIESDRFFIGMEIEEKYFQIGKDRIENLGQNKLKKK